MQQLTIFDVVVTAKTEEPSSAEKETCIHSYVKKLHRGQYISLEKHKDHTNIHLYRFHKLKEIGDKIYLVYEAALLNGIWKNCYPTQKGFYGIDVKNISNIELIMVNVRGMNHA